MAFTQVQVTGTYRDPEGNDAHGAVVFTPTHAMRNGEITVAAPRTAQIIAGGISIDLAATDDPGTEPVGVAYRVEEQIIGTPVRRSYYLQIPAAGGPIDLGDAALAEQAPPTVQTYLTQAAGDARYEPLGGGTAAAGRAAALALILGS